MKLSKLFKKNKITEQVEPVVIEQPEEKRVGYLEYWAKLGKSLRKESNSREEILKKLFPRGPHTMQTVNAKTGVAMDSMLKPAMYNNDLPDEMLPFFTHTFIGWQACALLAQNPYIKKVCEIPAREAVAVDYVLQYIDGEDKDDSTKKDEEQERLNKMKRKSDKEMHIKDIIRDANIYKKMYGQIVVIPTFNVDVDMSKPFKPERIKAGTYTGLAIIQPFWLTYQLSEDGVCNPNKSGYYDPEYYIVNGHTKIHKSWCRKLVNGVCPDILKPVYYYGGIPLVQQIYERVFCAEKTANEAPKLALTKRLLVVDGNVNNMTANPDEAYATLQSVLEVRDNMGIMVKNPGDQVNQIDTSLTDFDALINTQFQLVAAIGEMPATKLMKTQLKGLANSGDYEMRDYNQTLVEIQENDYNTLLEFHYQLMSISEHGKDLGIQVVWNPIDTPTEKEIAEIEQIQANTDSVYVGAGVIDPSEIRDSLRNNEDSRYHNLSEEMPEPDFGDMMGEENEPQKDKKTEDEDDTDEETQYAYAVEGVEI